MSDITKIKVAEEGVIIIYGENGDPIAMVHRSSLNGGKIEIYGLDLMGFSDIKAFLDKITQAPIVVGGKT